MKILMQISIIAVTAVCGTQVTAQSPPLSRANDLYRNDKFPEAAQEYQKALGNNPADTIAAYNLGNAYYKSKKHVEAAQVFDEVITRVSDSGFLQKAYYNKGVSLSAQDRLEESISAYKKALTLDPADVDTRINLQKALLELQKKNPPEKSPNSEENNDNQQDPSKNKNQSPQSRLTEKQVEQRLRALQQKEQQVQQKMQRYRQRTAGKQEKDW